MSGLEEDTAVKKAKQTHVVIGMICLTVVLLLVMVGVFRYSNQSIANGYLEITGYSAENVAIIAAKNLQMTDTEVEELKAMSYADSLRSEENLRLQAMFSDPVLQERVQYAYVIILLDEDEVRFTVDESNSDYFNQAELGTPLDVMFLLDVDVIEPQDASEVTEIERYSYYIPADDQIFGGRPNYVLNETEWGTYISGYAPLYDQNGEMIGVLGVDMVTDSYDLHRIDAVNMLELLLAVISAALILMFFVIYRRFRKMQFDKVNRDSLTGIYNRRFHRDYFLKRIRRGDHRGELLLMMMIDVDYFKQFNDQYGHSVGDEVLCAISTLLSKALPQAELVRWGGEEFFAGTWIKDLDAAKLLLDNLFDQVHESRFGTQHLKANISLGCCYACLDSLDWDILRKMQQQADQLLYHAKETGRDHYEMGEFQTENVDDVQ